MSRTTHANLFSKIGTTYGSGDDSTTFNVPDLTDRFIQGNNTAGTVKSAGLPNIEGHFYNAPAYGAAGAFADSIAGTGQAIGAGGYYTPYDVYFDASDSNAIYGNSTTVQPPALTMRFAIFAGHSALFRWIRTA